MEIDVWMAQLLSAYAEALMAKKVDPGQVPAKVERVKYTLASMLASDLMQPVV